MANLTVGAGQQYTTIAAAVAASGSGDTVNVQAGTYTNDFVTIRHDLSLNAVGGTVAMVATQQPPNGKAMITEGNPGVNVSVTGFDISGVTVPDANGAAVRYEGGNLTLSNDTIHGNQDGILTAADPNGTITITGSNFYGNGIGDGHTHNIYVGNIASLTVTNSTVMGAVGGHDIKSRAASNTITNNIIGDGSGGTTSYEIDLPNGGQGMISGNVIQKGTTATSPVAIAFGEEGNTYGNSSLTVQNNTMVNAYTDHYTTGVANATGTTATITGNSVYGWSNLSSGPASASGNTTLLAEPPLSSLKPGNSTGGSASSSSTGAGPATGSTGTGSIGAGSADTSSASAPPASASSSGPSSTGTPATGTPPTDTSPSTSAGSSGTASTPPDSSTAVTTGSLGSSSSQPAFLPSGSGSSGATQGTGSSSAAPAPSSASTPTDWSAFFPANWPWPQSETWSASTGTQPSQASASSLVPDTSAGATQQYLTLQGS